MSFYTTLARARSEVRATTTVDDAVLRRYIQDVSDRIDLIMGFRSNGGIRPFFIPYTEARQIPIVAKTIDSSQNTLQFPDHLLSFSIVSIEGTAVTSNVQMYPPNQTPACNVSTLAHALA